VSHPAIILVSLYHPRQEWSTILPLFLSIVMVSSPYIACSKSKFSVPNSCKGSKRKTPRKIRGSASLEGLGAVAAMVFIAALIVATAFPALLWSMRSGREDDTGAASSSTSLV
jgi:hypothetical protein